VLQRLPYVAGNVDRARQDLPRAGSEAPKGCSEPPARGPDGDMTVN